MAGDSKYGRLFTEADVKRLLRFAAMRGEQVGYNGLGRDAAGMALDDLLVYLLLLKGRVIDTRRRVENPFNSPTLAPMRRAEHQAGDAS